MHPLLQDEPGRKHLLLGNEAIVRGAVEAGVRFISCYPGTPSSEAPDTFHRMVKDADYDFEYSPNEKVALEVAGGATLGGALSLCTMKHVGVNVAADPLYTLAYIGTPGGLVLLSADDPGCHSSQNEQDNRSYARSAFLPCFEPATAQEAKDMCREALLSSRDWEHPVLLRTTTRVNHVRGAVEWGPVRKPATDKAFQKNPRRFVPVPAHARALHLEVMRRFEDFVRFSETTPWNKVTGSGRVGVIASGISRAYLADVVAEDGLADKLTVLDLGFTHPLPKQKILELCKGVDRLLILEELEPIVETEVRALVQKEGLSTPVHGKDAGLPVNGEYSTALVRAALRQALGEGEGESPSFCGTDRDLPMRPPNLCPGCAHRSVYYAVRKVYGDEACYSSDIGCYTLGLLPPLRMADFLLCMGSSISAGSGLAAVTDKPVVAFIGDSTFFHTGINGLINAVFNRRDVLLVILDNQTTAMTGHQPHPGVPEQVLEASCGQCRVDIEALCRATGVDEVRTVKAFNLKALDETLQDLKAKSGVRVLIAQEPCILFARRTLGAKPKMVAYVAEQGPDVEACLAELACPAFYRDADRAIRVDENMCTGCMVCLQTASGIKAKQRGA